MATLKIAQSLLTIVQWATVDDLTWISPPLVTDHAIWCIVYSSLDFLYCEVSTLGKVRLSPYIWSLFVEFGQSHPRLFRLGMVKTSLKPQGLWQVCSLTHTTIGVSERTLTKPSEKNHYMFFLSANGSTKMISARNSGILT